MSNNEAEKNKQKLEKRVSGRSIEGSFEKNHHRVHDFFPALHSHSSIQMILQTMNCVFSRQRLPRTSLNGQTR